MKKLGLLVMPLMAISLLSSCGCSKPEPAPKLPDYAIKISIELEEEKEISFICESDNEFAVDWGDGTINSETSHTYQAGLYNVQIDSQLKSFAINHEHEAVKYVKELEVGNVLSLGITSFEACLNLRSVVFDEDTPLADIGEHAFAGCESLTSISIPKNITSIADTTFDDCIALASVNLPNGLTTIGNGAFSGCESLTSIDLPNGLTMIGSKAFSGCISLSSISIPDSIEQIGNDAFTECPLNCNLKDNIKYLGNDIHPYIVAVEPIDGASTYNFDGNCKIICNTFSDNPLLTSITIGSKVALITSGAFLNCPNLESIVIDSNNEKYESGNYNAIIEKSSNTLMLGCKNTVIPNNVVTIGDSAFSNCASLSSIIIPNNVIKIGNSAFSGCESLTSIDLPNGLTMIGSKAFSGCISLSSISIPDSIEQLGDNAFSGCPLNYNSKGDIDYLGNNANPYLVAIKITHDKTTFEIDGNCRVIYSSAFYYKSQSIRPSTKLTNIVIPRSVISIGDKAFNYCGNLNSIIFESDSLLKTIGSLAFNGTFTRISIPSRVTLIGMLAFAMCTKLSILDLTQLSAPPKADDAIDPPRYNGLVYVTSKTIQAFKADKYWSRFRDKLTDDQVPEL
ncbi:MAG: leucine-rich repeat domain-containing protein [Bacilli bacterium]|nr:leucine-rich repeat domain-containing protein [Bacilli bacterium]